MYLRLRVLLLAVAPLLLAVAAIAAVVRIEARSLAEAETAVVLPVLAEARRDEIRHYVELAVGAVEHLHVRPDEDRAKTEALDVLRRLDYGDDGYFFVYDLNGRNLMHPRQPQLVGQDLWNLRDPNGQPTIQRLIAKAKAGGGYVEFLWNRPSTRRMEPKLGYVALEPKWGWMIGTGIYLDTLETARMNIDREASRAISATMGIIVAIAIVAAFLVAIGGLALNLSDQRVADAKIRALARQVVLSQETERARVASELHDGVNQLLVSAKYVFESVQARVGALPAEVSEGFVAILAQGLDRLNEVLREVRRISHGLRPTALDDLGLEAALQQMLTEFGRRTELGTHFNVDGTLLLPEAVATALFRVVQEALTNIERHARATAVEVSFFHSSHALRLVIADNGAGFSVEDVAAQPRNGLGLTSMRERVAPFGGSFNVVSDTDGTRIEIVIPAAALRP